MFMSKSKMKSTEPPVGWELFFHMVYLILKGAVVSSGLVSISIAVFGHLPLWKKFLAMLPQFFGLYVVLTAFLFLYGKWRRRREEMNSPFVCDFCGRAVHFENQCRSWSHFSVGKLDHKVRKIKRIEYNGIVGESGIENQIV
jgi:hypothetical protein